VSRTVVIFNPTARGEKANQFRAQLTAAAAGAGKQVMLKPTRGPADATVLAEESILEGFETIVAAGGDGTVNEVVNGIARVPDGPERARLGVLPLGTVNVFAKELRLPEDFVGGWRTLV
jgi:diacylglycerol kinase family enzyme